MRAARHRFRDLAADIVILDHDVQSVFHFGEKTCDRHGIELGKVSEQAGIGVEIVDFVRVEAEHVAQDLSQIAVDGCTAAQRIVGRGDPLSGHDRCFIHC